MEFVELYLKVLFGSLIFGFGVMTVALIVIALFFKKAWNEIKRAYWNWFN